MIWKSWIVLQLMSQTVPKMILSIRKGNTSICESSIPQTKSSKHKYVGNEIPPVNRLDNPGVRPGRALLPVVCGHPNPRGHSTSVRLRCSPGFVLCLNRKIVGFDRRFWCILSFLCRYEIRSVLKVPTYLYQFIVTFFVHSAKYIAQNLIKPLQLNNLM